MTHNTIDEIVKDMKEKLDLDCWSPECDCSGSEKVEAWLRTTLTQDRASLHTSLVAAVEGLEITSKPELKFVNPHIKTWEDGYNFALDDTLTIINSIFKE